MRCGRHLTVFIVFTHNSLKGIQSTRVSNDVLNTRPSIPLVSVVLPRDDDSAL